MNASIRKNKLHLVNKDIAFAKSFKSESYFKMVKDSLLKNCISIPDGRK